MKPPLIGWSTMTFWPGWSLEEGQVSAGERKPDALLSVSPAGVLVTFIRPLAPGGGYLVRLFNASGSFVDAKLHCRESARSVYRSSALEEKGERIDVLTLPPDGSATVRVE